MSYWVLVVAPLALASFVMLFAFVGCGLNAEGEQAGEPQPETYPGEVLKNTSLVGYWRLGEEKLPTAVDSSANGNNDGEYTGTVTLGQPGLLVGDSDTAVQFDGSTGYVKVPYNAELNPAKFTVEAIVNGGGSPTLFGAVVSSRDQDPDTNLFGFILYASDQGKWEAWVGEGGNAWKIVQPGADVVMGEKTYLAMTYDGQNLRLYVNPQSDTPGEPASYQPNTTRELRIGAGRNEQVDPIHFFNGVIDEVAIYNVDLKFDEIKKHFDLSVNGPTVPD